MEGGGGERAKQGGRPCLKKYLIKDGTYSKIGEGALSKGDATVQRIVMPLSKEIVKKFVKNPN